MQRKIFYADHNSQPQGPFGLEELQELFAAGTIHERTQIITEGESEWRPLDEDDELVALIEPAAPIEDTRVYLSPEAQGLLNQVKYQGGEFDAGLMAEFPNCDGGNFFLFDMCCFLREAVDRQHRPLLGAPLVLYVTTKRKELTLWSEARISGGDELEVNYVTSDRQGNNVFEHLTVELPDEVLWASIGQDLRMRISDGGFAEQIVTVPAVFIDAALASRYPERFDTSMPANGKSVSQSSVQSGAEPHAPLSIGKVFVHLAGALTCLFVGQGAALSGSPWWALSFLVLAIFWYSASGLGVERRRWVHVVASLVAGFFGLVQFGDGHWVFGLLDAVLVLLFIGIMINAKDAQKSGQTVAAEQETARA